MSILHNPLVTINPDNPAKEISKTRYNNPHTIEDGTITSTHLAAAVSDKLVTNGDLHNHSGGDGGQIAYGSLSGTPSTLPPDAHGNEKHTSTFITAAALADYVPLAGGTMSGTLNVMPASGTKAIKVASGFKITLDGV